jgi:hypothetical protein
MVKLAGGAEWLRRQDVVRRFDALWERLLTTYGKQPDRGMSICEDRKRSLMDKKV